MIWNFVAGMSGVAQAVLALSIIGTFGLWLGRFEFKGAGLGIGGVLFAGLFVGDFAKRLGVHLEAEVLDFVREFGLILFVYTIGIQVGPGFFTALKKAGLKLNLIAASIVVGGAATAALIHLFAHVPLPAMLGVLSGATTNTPSLGAAQQVLRDMGLPGSQVGLTGLGYAVAYPFGIVGILLTMTAVRTVFRIDPEHAAREFEARRRREVAEIETLDVLVTRTELAEKTISQLPGLTSGEVVVSRLMRDGHLRVPHDTTWVEVGDVLHLVGPKTRLAAVAGEIGEVHATPLTTKGTDLTWERIVVTSDHVLGQSIAALNLEGRFDVRISRVLRTGVELVAPPALKLQFGDILNVIGRREDLEKVAGFVGNSEQRLKEFDPIPMFIGIALGIALGSIDLSFGLLGGTPIKLGLAGGPLLAAIVLSRIGHVGSLVWFMPPIANHAIRELGIVLFLAVVGFKSGGSFLTTLTDGDGLAWVGWGAVVTLTPLMIAAFVGKVLLKVDYLSLCGLLAGSMTDPPALAFANAMAPKSEAQSLAYATVYPLVMGLRILSPQILALILVGSGLG
ncbi:MAG: putative transporter [Hyphomicrobiales bacterium]|nr:putative transporter [Hyphomicrobiales bacterium]